MRLATALAAHETAAMQAQKLWNSHPCGELPTDCHDALYFRRVEEERYRQQYWQHSFFDFTSFAGKRVLEIGVGHGTDMKQFARAGAECFGLDLAETHLRLCRINMAGEGYFPHLQQGDAASIPFPDGYFDCVYSFGALHTMPDIERVLPEIRRVLKPDGVLQASVYHLWSVHTALLFLLAIKDGSLFRKGIAGILATIERGADGVIVKPFCRLYSLYGWNKLLRQHGFTVTKSGVRQVYDDCTPLIDRLRPLERLLGWYVAGFYRR